MRVAIYRNLSNGKFSVQARETTDTEKYGTLLKSVYPYAIEFHLTNARFDVQPAGRRLMVETGRRNVHAFIVGDLEFMNSFMQSNLVLALWLRHSRQLAVEGTQVVEVCYTPSYANYFYNVYNLKPVEKAVGVYGIIANGRSRIFAQIDV